MIKCHFLTPTDLLPRLDSFFAMAGPKIRRLAGSWDRSRGAPVFTRRGRYTSRGWTEWTEGFLYGCRLLQFDALHDEALLASGRADTLAYMPGHLTHTGVHDHGFNNLSTYGNLRRLALEGRTDDGPEAVALYELAIRVSGAVQASRWTPLDGERGYIHSFNGVHSLFSDTMRSCRILVLADLLGQTLMSEGDRRNSLAARAAAHMRETLRHNVYYGKGRDAYDVRGRVAHESLFNARDGSYRCPGTQQGYSPFSTWTRGLAWVLLGCAEQLEFFRAHPRVPARVPDAAALMRVLLEGASATADFYIAHTPTDGIPYWDTGAPGLVQLGDYLDRPAEPDNPHEPVDSSAAAIAAQGLLRLGSLLGPTKRGRRYFQAGLTVAQTVFGPPYLSENPRHQGLILHSIYHRPNGWDHQPPGKQTPQGESSMWGDYHAMELAVYLLRLARKQPYLTFWGPTQSAS